MAEAAAPPVETLTRVGYNVDGKRVALKCSMGVVGICIAVTKRAYDTGKKKGKLLWQAERACYYCSRCLAHADAEATQIATASRQRMIGVTEEVLQAASAHKRAALGAHEDAGGKRQRPAPTPSDGEPQKTSAAAARPTAAKPARSRRKIGTMSEGEAKEQCRTQAAEIKALERKVAHRQHVWPGYASRWSN